jgi:hypothetical protein
MGSGLVALKNNFPGSLTIVRLLISSLNRPIQKAIHLALHQSKPGVGSIPHTRFFVVEPMLSSSLT